MFALERRIRIDVIAIVLVHLSIGIWWVVAQPFVTSSNHAFDPARQILSWSPVYPMRAYGFVAALASALFLLSLAVRNRHLAIASIACSFGFWLMFACLFVVAAFTSHGAGVVGALWASMAAFLHWRIASGLNLFTELSRK